MVRVDPRNGDPRWRMDRLKSMAAIDFEFKLNGMTLFVDTDGMLMVWGGNSRRAELSEQLTGREGSMKRFLIARALREEG
jgi:hypothetical protein